MAMRRASLTLHPPPLPTSLSRQVYLYQGQDEMVIAGADGKSSDESQLAFHVVASQQASDLVLSPSAGAPIPSVLEGKQRLNPVYGVLGCIKLFAGPYLLLITHANRLGNVLGHDLYQIVKVMTIEVPPKSSESLEGELLKLERHYLANILDLLSSGSFYFSYSYDITRANQPMINVSADEMSLPLWERADTRFYWNKYLQHDFIQLRLHPLLIPVMKGYCQFERCMLKDKCFNHVLISRRSRFRSGTRYYTRGVDAKGNVANFVETEMIMTHDEKSSEGSSPGNNDEVTKKVYSYIITRGSVPIYWYQRGLRYNPRPRVEPVELSVEPFTRHFMDQLSHYQKQVVVSLVNQSGPEKLVGDSFGQLLEQLDHSGIRYVPYDFHREKGDRHKLIDMIGDSIKEGRYFLREYTKDAEGHWVVKRSRESVELSDTAESAPLGVKSVQQNVFRINCMDCLDRTNVVQSIVSKEVWTEWLKILGLLGEFETLAEFPAFETQLKHMWANNGDALSIQYTGTGALKADITRTGKRSIQGMVNDGVNSVVRYYLNNFKDSEKQEAINLVLGLSSAIQERTALVEEKESIPIIDERGCFTFVVERITAKGRSPCKMILNTTALTIYLMPENMALPEDEKIPEGIDEFEEDNPCSTVVEEDEGEGEDTQKEETPPSGPTEAQSREGDADDGGGKDASSTQLYFPPTLTKGSSVVHLDGTSIEATSPMTVALLQSEEREREQHEEEVLLSARRKKKDDDEGEESPTATSEAAPVEEIPFDASKVTIYNCQSLQQIQYSLEDKCRLRFLLTNCQEDIRFSSKVMREYAAAQARSHFGILVGDEKSIRVIHQCQRAIVAEEETFLKAWFVVSINQWDIEQERLLILSDTAMYRVKYNFGSSEIVRWDRVELETIIRIDVGPIESKRKPKPDKDRPKRKSLLPFRRTSMQPSSPTPPSPVAISESGSEPSSPVSSPSTSTNNEDGIQELEIGRFGFRVHLEELGGKKKNPFKKQQPYRTYLPLVTKDVQDAMTKVDGIAPGDLQKHVTQDIIATIKTACEKCGKDVEINAEGGIDRTQYLGPVANALNFAKIGHFRKPRVNFDSNTPRS